MDGKTDWQGVALVITAIFSGISMVIAAIGAAYAARAHAVSSSAKAELVSTKQELVKNTALTEQAASGVEEVKLATNGMKDDLITAVREQALQAGEIKGRAEEKAEREQHG